FLLKEKNKIVLFHLIGHFLDIKKSFVYYQNTVIDNLMFHVLIYNILKLYVTMPVLWLNKLFY
uniref:hypothetical protein n=1 Tax=Thomasclavelia spiroformis TaxID=29348 RepID=UPI00241F3E56